MAHSAVCGGAQAFGVPGEVLKMHDFFDWLALFLRKCSRVDFASQETCSPIVYHWAGIKFRCANSKFNLGTPKNQLPDCQIMVFHQIHDVADGKARRVSGYFCVSHTIHRECLRVDNSP